MRVRRTNSQLLLPGGATPEADKQPASTDRLERAGLIGVGNAHLFFVQGVHEPALRSTLTMTHRKENGRMVILSTADRRTYEVRDVDAWDNHTEILSVESAAVGTPDPAFETETWVRRRFITGEGETETGGPAGNWVPESVELSFIAEPGDEIDDFAPLRAQAVAVKGTLENGDLLIHPVHGTFQVRGVEVQGEYERARLQA